tara:strand:+ start:1843 stop:2559 length:717 start_codon:yes stop_codon:yes gene_type:complete
MKLIKNESSFTITGFKRTHPYQYKEYTRNDNDGPRTYNIKDKKVPSVTTILSGTQSEEKRKALGDWRDRIGHEEAARITTQAATRGTEMHYVLEQYMNGVGYLNLRKDGHLPRIMAHTIIKNLQDLSEVYGTEVNLAYEDRWAGSADLICNYKDKPTIGDFKQSNKPKREEWIEDYFYQIGAYSLAHKKQYGDIEQGVILVCTKDLLFQEFFMNKSKLNEYEERWLERVDKYHKNTNF